MKTPSTAALILAAGASRRFGGNKQLAIYQGKSLLANTVEQSLLAGCSAVYVVCGFNAEQIMAEAAGAGATPFYHSRWEAGMRSSLKAGLMEVAKQSAWRQLLILPCDLPRFRSEEIREFKVAMQQHESKGPVAIDYPEGPGLPLLLPRAFLEEHGYFESPATSSMRGESQNSLRWVLSNHPNVKLLPSGPHTEDIDWPEDL
jgi:CTP:molybdopterin cytidylyltransferase MocA